MLFLNNTETIEPAEDDNSSTDEPLDGANLLRRSLKNDIGPEVITTTSLPEKKVLNRKQIMEFFVPSKWDTVDPQEVEAQAMSTEKMYYMELEARLNSSSLEKVKCDGSDRDGRHGKWKSGKAKRKKNKDRNAGDSSQSKRAKNKK